MPTFTIDPASGGVRAHFWGDNGKLVWWTEVYERKAGALHAINLMKQYAPSAPVIDRAKQAA
jgi:uncharacterized protein YegP (UPF0339 family)